MNDQNYPVQVRDSTDHQHSQPPVAVTKSPILQDTGVKVKDQGEFVAFTIGNEAPFVMHYEDMLRFAQILRLHAKRAKARAGDTRRHWSAVGICEDISQIEEGR